MMIIIYMNMFPIVKRRWRPKGVTLKEGVVFFCAATTEADTSTLAFFQIEYFPPSDKWGMAVLYSGNK